MNLTRLEVTPMPQICSAMKIARMFGDALHLLTITEAMKKIVAFTAEGPILMETMRIIQQDVTLHHQVALYFR